MHGTTVKAFAPTPTQNPETVTGNGLWTDKTPFSSGWVLGAVKAAYSSGEGMWIRLIHLAQQQQRNNYKIIKFPKDSMDSKWGFTNFAEIWNGRLAMMGFIIGLGTELLTGQGILDQMGMGWWRKSRLMFGHPKQTLGTSSSFTRDACGSNLYRWEHSTWLNLDGHGYWAVIHELTTF